MRTQTLKEAVDSAFETWSQEMDCSFYVIGSVVGPQSVSNDGP
jgi:tryptophan synthase beta subunit